MAFFKKNKDQDYEEDEFSADANDGGKFSKRAFRDLKSENKKKRKEPPKPWGRKERLIILTILLLTVIISAVLAFGSNRGTKINFKNINFPKFDFGSLNIFKEETIMIEKK